MEKENDTENDKINTEANFKEWEFITEERENLRTTTTAVLNSQAVLLQAQAEFELGKKNFLLHQESIIISKKTLEALTRIASALEKSNC